MRRVQLHLPQQVIGGLRLRDEQDGASQVAHGTPGLLGVEVETTRDVLEVGDSADVVEILPADGDAGEAGAEEQIHRLLQADVRIDGDEVGARYHDLVRRGVREVEHGLDHLAFAVFDDVGFAGTFDEVAQLFGGHERTVLVHLVGCEQIAEHDEDAGQRLECDEDDAHDPAEVEAHGQRPPFADRARGHSGDDEDRHRGGDHREEDHERSHGVVGVVGQGDEDRGECFEEGADEDDDVDVRRQVREDPLHAHS